MNVLFRTDASPEIGIGHIMRCYALAEALSQKSCIVSLLINDKTMSRMDLWVNSDIDIYEMPYEIGSEQDVNYTRNLASRLKSQWIVIDGYHFGNEYQKNIKDNSYKLLYIDDFSKGEIHADLILNQSPNAENNSDYSNTKGKLFLLGEKYVLIRESIRKKKHIGGAGMLATFGGGCVDVYVEQLLQSYFDRKSDFQINILSNKKIKLNNDNIKFWPITKNELLMAQSDFALSAGGVSSLELAHIGVPLIMLVLDENQRSNAKALVEAKCAISVDSIDESIKVAKMLSNNEEKRNSMSHKGKLLIDGCGPNRVTNAMFSLVE